MDLLDNYIIVGEKTNEEEDFFAAVLSATVMLAGCGEGQSAPANSTADNQSSSIVMSDSSPSSASSEDVSSLSSSTQSNSANASETDFEYTIVGNEVTITKYKGSDEEVNIPESIKNMPVTSVGYGAFKDCTSLTSINIPNGVAKIGAYAFESCTSLTSITIPNSVTDIGSWIFQDCSSLTSIILPDSITSITVEMFSGCKSLTSITIPDSVTFIGTDAFSGCKNIQITFNGNTYDYDHIDDLYNAINGD